MMESRRDREKGYHGRRVDVHQRRRRGTGTGASEMQRLGESVGEEEVKNQRSADLETKGI